jgi:hypothetical protein
VVLGLQFHLGLTVLLRVLLVLKRSLLLPAL